MKAKPKNSGKTAKRRKTGGRDFKPGQSGNPKGRPPLPLDYKLAMEEIGPAATNALKAIIDNPDHPRHEQAVEYAMNRWKGTPTSRTEIAGPGGGPVPVQAVTTSGAKRARVAELLATAAARAATKAGSDDGDDGAGSGR